MRPSFGIATVPLLLTNVAHHHHVPPRATIPRLAEGDATTEKAPNAGGFPLPFLNRGVPQDQQPIMELQNLRTQSFMDWAETDEYKSKLTNLYLAVMLFAALPISYTTFYNLPNELPQLLIAANIGAFPVLIAFVLRLRVGWGFVSSRLSSRKIYYEAQQTGLLAPKDKATRMRDTERSHESKI